MSTVRIHVTQDDIYKGQPGNSARCPVALALSREIGRPCWAGNPNWGYIITSSIFPEIFESLLPVPSYRPEGMLPENAIEYILEFDSEVYGQPFEFEVEVP